MIPMVDPTFSNLSTDMEHGFEPYQVLSSRGVTTSSNNFRLPPMNLSPPNYGHLYQARNDRQQRYSAPSSEFQQRVQTSPPLNTHEPSISISTSPSTWLPPIEWTGPLIPDEPLQARVNDANVEEGETSQYHGHSFHDLPPMAVEFTHDQAHGFENLQPTVEESARPYPWLSELESNHRRRNVRLHVHLKQRNHPPLFPRRPTSSKNTSQLPLLLLLLPTPYAIPLHNLHAPTIPLPHLLLLSMPLPVFLLHCAPAPSTPSPSSPPSPAPLLSLPSPLSSLPHPRRHHLFHPYPYHPNSTSHPHHNPYHPYHPYHPSSTHLHPPHAKDPNRLHPAHNPQLWHRALELGDHAAELEAVRRLGGLYGWVERVVGAATGGGWVTGEASGEWVAERVCTGDKAEENGGEEGGFRMLDKREVEGVVLAARDLVMGVRGEEGVRSVEALLLGGVGL